MQWKLISDNTFHKLLKCKPCVGAKLVLRFQALITHTFLDRSILFLYRESACTSGSISRKRISFISRFGTIVSYFVTGDIFFDSPCTAASEWTGHCNFDFLPIHILIRYCYIYDLVNCHLIQYHQVYTWYKEKTLHFYGCHGYDQEQSMHAVSSLLYVDKHVQSTVK